jgi:hypothetical protein
VGWPVRNGQGRYLEKYLERTCVERYREVSVYTGVYHTKRDERQGRGPEAISQESEVKSVNCCVEN